MPISKAEFRKSLESQRAKRKEDEGGKSCPHRHGLSVSYRIEDSYDDLIYPEISNDNTELCLYASEDVRMTKGNAAIIPLHVQLQCHNGVLYIAEPLHAKVPYTIVDAIAKQYGRVVGSNFTENLKLLVIPHEDYTLKAKQLCASARVIIPGDYIHYCSQVLNTTAEEVDAMNDIDVARRYCEYLFKSHIHVLTTADDFGKAKASQGDDVPPVIVPVGAKGIINGPRAFILIYSKETRLWFEYEQNNVTHSCTNSVQLMRSVLKGESSFYPF